MNTKKVLGIVASCRKLGNTEIAVKSIAEKMGSDWELSLIRLPKLSILPCKGCYACLLPGKHCQLGDDVDWLLKSIDQADAIIFGAPNYTLAPVGIVKMLADRSIQAFGFYEQFRKKKTAVILTLGREEYRGYADTALAAQVATLGLDIVSLEYFYGTHPGEVGLAEDFEKRVHLIAAALVSPDFERLTPPGRCPVCLSDLFRVHPEGLECAICKALAKQQGESLDFFFFHPEFTEEGRFEHMNWLLMKKEEYPRIKDRLKRIQDRYQQGNWLLPSS